MGIRYRNNNNNNNKSNSPPSSFTGINGCSPTFAFVDDDEPKTTTTTTKKLWRHGFVAKMIRTRKLRLMIYVLGLTLVSVSTVNLVILNQRQTTTTTTTTTTDAISSFMEGRIHYFVSVLAETRRFQVTAPIRQGMFPRVFDFGNVKPHKLFYSKAQGRRRRRRPPPPSDGDLLRNEIVRVSTPKGKMIPAPRPGRQTSQSYEQTGPPVHDEPLLNDGECIPMASWQTASYPTCNSLHDIDMRAGLLTEWLKPTIQILYPSNNATTAGNFSNTAKQQTAEPIMVKSSNPWPTLSIIAKGWFRTTWEWHNHQPNQDVDDDILVLKTLRLEREFLSEYYELHNRDAVAMERLTFSPHVVNIYGYCAQSAINEYANFPYGSDIKTVEKLARRMRGKRDIRAMLLRLVIATGIAQGLAHVHRAGSTWQVDSTVSLKKLPPQKSKSGNHRYYHNNDNDYQPALMVHYDINPRNIALFKGGRPKINDFNIAEFIKYNPQTKTTCGFESRMHAPWWRSPEEVRTGDSPPTLLDEKVDIYALGNTLFHLFTSYAPRGMMLPEREEGVRQQVLAGEAPVMLPEFQNATDVISQTFRHVLSKCHAPNPKHRWSAQQISNYLVQTLHEQKQALMRQVAQQQLPRAAGVGGNSDTSSLVMSRPRSQGGKQGSDGGEFNDEDDDGFVEAKG